MQGITARFLDDWSSDLWNVVKRHKSNKLVTPYVVNKIARLLFVEYFTKIGIVSSVNQYYSFSFHSWICLMYHSLMTCLSRLHKKKIIWDKCLKNKMKFLECFAEEKWLLLELVYFSNKYKIINRTPCP